MSLYYFILPLRIQCFVTMFQCARESLVLPLTIEFSNVEQSHILRPNAGLTSSTQQHFSGIEPIIKFSIKIAKKLLPFPACMINTTRANADDSALVQLHQIHNVDDLLGSAKDQKLA